MQKNVGNADRVIRIILGIGTIAIGFYYGSWWGATGIVLLFTGITGWCPAYLPFGISSCPVRRAH